LIFMTVSPGNPFWSSSKKRLFSDPVLIAAFVLMAIFLIFGIAETRLLELVPNERLFSRPVLSAGSLTGEQPSIDLGAVGEPGDYSTMLIRLDFKTSDTTNYPNLLQTDSLNRGLRLESSGRTFGLVAGSPTTPPEGFILSENLSPNLWHSLILRVIGGHYVSIKIDGVAVGPLILSIPFSMQNVRIGIGYDDVRRFQGTIKNINVFVGSSHLLGIWLAILDVRIRWLLIAFLIVFTQRYFAFNPLTPADRLRFSALKRVSQQVPPTFLSPIIFLSILLNLSAILYSFAARHFLQESEIVAKALLPGFERLNGAPPFNSTLPIFILVEMSLIGSLASCWVITLLGGLRLDLVSRNMVVAATCIFSAASFFLIDGSVPRLLVACAIALPLIPMMLWSGIVHALPNTPLVAALAVLRRIYNSLQLVIAAKESLTAAASAALLRQTTQLSPIAGKGLIFAAGILLCGILAWPVFQTWYPVVIPNDYVEATDSFQIRNPSGTVDIVRDEIAECLSVPDSQDSDEASSTTRNRPSNFNCRGLILPKADRKHLKDSVMATASWQGEVGRTLFHHSYIFVPARRFLTYGFDQAVPYLYGYGNTIFHAFLMQLDGGATLSSYFRTFPIAELVGLIAIALLVLLVTHSGWMTLSGFALSLIAFYSITYVPVFLAASFSPARYLGLVLQMASMCLCCRNAIGARFLLLPATAALSLFWNAEFALLGLAGQVLLTIAPRIRLTLAQRALLLVSLIACPLGYTSFFHGSPDIIKTVQLSFFNIGMPFMNRTETVWFFVGLIAAEFFLFCMSMLFSGNERTLRLCYLPVLALLMVKYIYNPAPPHLYLVFTSLWPVLLLYLPPPSSTAHPMRIGSALIDSILVAAVAVPFAVQAGITYGEEAKAFRTQYISDFVVNTWGSLGESIGFVAPELPISERVKSIKKQITPEDTLIILSPYDQILNFYINSQKICGHFDLLSNLATKDIENALLTCSIRSSKTLIVYDHASETPCPTGYLQTQSRCALKATTKGNLTDFRDRLLPFVKLVGSDENLLFYRPTGPSAQNANASIN
jgi:hypothetical protein